MIERFQSLLAHYERLGDGPEFELFRALYRCMALERRLADATAAKPAARPRKPRAAPRPGPRPKAKPRASGRRKRAA